MHYRKCGQNGLELPVLGIGCWPFGGGDYWGEQKQGDVDAVVNTAIDLGCNYFDTAEVYNDGASEISLGKALKGKRSKAIIGSKVSPDHLYPALLRKHCEASLRRLDTDYIDLYMIHWPVNRRALMHYTSDPAILNSPPDIREALETMSALKAEGKIRHIGISNFGVRQMSEVLGMGFAIDANELGYNLLFRSPEIGIFPLCRREKVGAITYMPLMQGLLSGKYASLDAIPAQRTRTRQFSSERKGSRHGEPGQEALLTASLARIGTLAAENHIPMHRLALAWELANEAATCTICGVRSTEQLLDNVAAVDYELSDTLYRELNAATDELKAALGPSLDLFESAADSRIE